MLSLTTPKPLFLHITPPPLCHKQYHLSTLTIACISSSSKPPNSQMKLIIPNSNSSSPQPQNLYQPYRPPPTPLPNKYRSLDTASIIEILSNRLGLWYEYAPLITNLFRDGFTPPSIEELTGISGVEQNRLVVAAQVRLSIAEDTEMDADVLSYFDSGGSEILYELRLLSTKQRAAAATYVILNRLDGEKAKEIARAIKDYPFRRDDPGWECFEYAKPGDCWAFTYVRLSREFVNNEEKRKSALVTALEVAESDKAKERIREELEGKEKVVEELEVETAVKVPVVRLRMGEVAEATTVVVLPVSEAKEGGVGVESVPRESKSVGDFGIVVADKGWDRWVVLPKWAPVAGLGSGGVAVSFPDAKALPWRVNRSYIDEKILVVVDREQRLVTTDEGFYLAAVGAGGAEGGLKVEKGSSLKEMGMTESLGMVVIVVRPPKNELDIVSDEDWD